MATDIIVPKFGLTVGEVEVVEWLRDIGDVLAEGDPVVLVTADKADVEVAAPVSGVLAERLVAEGKAVDVGAVIARMTVPGEAAGSEVTGSATGAAADAPADADGQAGSAAPVGPSSSPAPPAPAEQSPERRPARLLASPLARRVARDLGVDLTALAGTGPGGRIVREDIVRAATATKQTLAQPHAEMTGAGPLPTPSAPPGLVELPLSPVRKVTARRMAAASRTTAPATITMRCDLSQALLVQQRARAGGLNATLTHLVMTATARALSAHGGLNAYFVDGAVMASSAVNLGLAVDVDGDLMVPVVRDCDRLTLSELVAATGRAVDRARTRSLTPQDSADGTFTISNLGMFGVESFAPIINAPQVAILGVGGSTDEVVVVDGLPRVRPVTRLSLTFDHRAVDGAPAARFLGDLRAGLEAADSLHDGWPRGTRR